MTPESSTTAQSAELELTITRILDAPQSLVFKAWTDPKHLAQWWGPRGFTLPACKVELHAGGAYRFHMRNPDGGEHFSQGVFREVVEPERLVMVGSWADAQGNPTTAQTVLTINFEAQGAKTRLTLHQKGFESINARDLHRGGWTSSFERLAECLSDGRII